MRPVQLGPEIRSLRMGRNAFVVAMGLALFACPVGAADEVTRTPAEPGLVVPIGDGPAPRDGASGPGLDALLQVPSDYLAPRGRTVGGVGEQEWRRRFALAHKQLRGAQSALDEIKQSLGEASEGSGASQWAVAPPGVSNAGGPTNSPLSFRLRQELVRKREDLEAAERSLRDLRIEADLVGVPVDWRGDRDVPLGKRLPDSPYYN